MLVASLPALDAREAALSTAPPEAVASEMRDEAALATDEMAEDAEEAADETAVGTSAMLEWLL
jgi:hypothetical protein